jgi:hypothetical protein
MRANMCQRVDRSLEAVEGVSFATHDDFKRRVVFVLANFACSHTPIRSCEMTFPAVSDLPPSENSDVPLVAQLPVSVTSLAEILLVLNETESYHCSPSLRVGALVHANTRCHRGHGHRYR